jgi:hypothetical protein
MPRLLINKPRPLRPLPTRLQKPLTKRSQTQLIRQKSPDATAAQAEQVAKLADQGPQVPQGGGGNGGGGDGGGGNGGGGNVGGGINVNVGGGTPDGGTQVVGLSGFGPVFVPQPVVMPDPGPAPFDYYQPPPSPVSYGGPPPSTTTGRYGGTPGRPARRLTAIALGWNTDGAWVVRKNPNIDAATRDAVTQCNTQFGAMPSSPRPRSFASPLRAAMTMPPACSRPLVARWMRHAPLSWTR